MDGFAAGMIFQALSSLGGVARAAEFYKQVEASGVKLDPWSLSRFLCELELRSAQKAGDEIRVAESSIAEALSWEIHVIESLAVGPLRVVTLRWIAFRLAVAKGSTREAMAVLRHSGEMQGSDCLFKSLWEAFGEQRVLQIMPPPSDRKDDLRTHVDGWRHLHRYRKEIELMQYVLKVATPGCPKSVCNTIEHFAL